MALALDKPLQITVPRAHAQATQPQGLLLPLKDHQLAMLQRCFDIEKVAMMSPPKLGFMADCVAAGKSAVAIAMPFVEKCLYKRSSLNILVVPQNICLQWKAEIAKFTGQTFNILMLTDYAAISNLSYSPASISQYDIVLTTPMYFTTLSDFCEQGNIRPRRVIVDEADTVAHMITRRIPYVMTWFVSATMDRLPEAKNGMVQVGKEVVAHEDHDMDSVSRSALSTKKGVIRPQEVGTYEIPARMLRSGERVCRCDPTWVTDSFQIPGAVKHKVVVSNVIMDTLAALTYARMLKPQQLESANARDFRNLSVGDEDEFNILPSLIKKYQVRISDAKVTHEALRNAMHMEQRALECAAEIQRCTDYIKLIRDQAAASFLCQGTFEQLSRPNHLSSTTQNVCLMCPDCQAGYCKEWVIDQNQESCLRCGSKHPLEERNPGEPAKADNKICKLVEIIKSLLPEKPRIMVYAKYTKAFHDIRQQLAGTGLKIREADAGTVESAQKMLDEFKQGAWDVLLAESGLFCSGMNLPEVTDVCFLHVVHAYSQMQIAGRAQRPGRSAPCRIWTFLHDNETSAYHEPK